MLLLVFTYSVVTNVKVPKAPGLFLEDKSEIYIVQILIISFGGFRADFNPKKGYQNQHKTPQKIEPGLKNKANLYYFWYLSSKLL